MQGGDFGKWQLRCGMRYKKRGIMYEKFGVRDIIPTYRDWDFFVKIKESHSIKSTLEINKNKEINRRSVKIK